MKQNENSTGYIIGGTTLIGIGIGFVFIKTSPLLFVSSVLIGIGVGLIFTVFGKKDPGK